MNSQITHRRAMTPAEELFHVVKTHRSDPLRECVREALSNYFTHLNGHRVSNLYDLVLAEVRAVGLHHVKELFRGGRGPPAAHRARAHRRQPDPGGGAAGDQPQHPAQEARPLRHRVTGATPRSAQYA